MLAARFDNITSRRGINRLFENFFETVPTLSCVEFVDASAELMGRKGKG